MEVIELTVGSSQQAPSWLSFISNMTNALAWPIALIVIALIFKRPIVEILQKVRKLSYGETSIELDIEKAEEQLKEAIPDPVQPEASPEIEQRFDRLVKISPAAAITDAWKSIETELRRISDWLGYDQKRPVRTLSVLARLVQRNLLSAEIAETVNELRNIRNSAAHSDDISPDLALRFYDMSVQVLNELKSVET